MMKPKNSSCEQLDRASLPAPLHQVKVIDFSELLPGPFMTQMLADMGASITKVERPAHGDPVAISSPGLYAAINRNKEKICLNLKDSAGLSQAQELVRNADVLVETFRPGTMAKLGLGYDAVQALNPGIIYVSISGYGQHGPDAMLPGHDINYMAAAGALALAIQPDHQKTVLPPAALPYADLAGSMYALSAVLAALYQRKTTGLGQWLDVSLTQAVLHQMTPRLAVFEYKKLHGIDEQRQELVRPAYGCFRCRDGEYITIGALETHFFVRLMKALELNEFLDEPWCDPGYRKQRAEAVNRALEQKIASLDAEDLVSLLRHHDVPVMQVIPPSVLPTFGQHVARNAFFEGPYGTLPKFPVHMHGMKCDQSDGTAQ